MGFYCLCFPLPGAVYAVSEFRRQAVLTTSHLLVASGLLVASIGSTVGVPLGLEYVIGFFLQGSGRIGSHAAIMNGYLLLFASAIVEYFLGEGYGNGWTWAGLALALAGSLAAILELVGLLFGSPLGFLFVPFLLLGLVIFLARIGWRVLARTALAERPGRCFFLGTLWMILWVLFFIYNITNIFSKLEVADRAQAIIKARNAGLAEG